MKLAELNTTLQPRWGFRQDQVLSEITHDLRAPLSAIMGYLDLVGRQVQNFAPAKAVEYLSLAREASQRMNQMVNDILDMFHFENGQRFLYKKHLPVAPLLDNVSRTFTGLAELKHVSLQCTPPKLSNLTVWADQRYLGRVLDNLVANAIKFTPPGGTVKVCARQTAERTIFEVIDTGRGIPAAGRKRIFEKYNHVRRSDRHIGYGMGLSVVKMIVEAHQGHISVKSKPRKGSHFTFWLPTEPDRLPFPLSN